MESENLNVKFLNGGSLIIEGYKSPWNNRELWSTWNCDINLVKKMLGENLNNILEFGSYDGGDGIKYKYHFPKAHVYSIEPSPSCYEKIKQLEKYGLKVFNYAISDVDGVMDFYETFDNNKNNYAPCGSLNKKLVSTTTGKIPLTVMDPIKVQTKRLETFCTEQNISIIDFLHVDVEGFSVEVLNGLGNLKPRGIYIEVASETHNHSEVVKGILEKDYVKITTRGADEFWVLKSNPTI